MFRIKEFVKKYYCLSVSRVRKLEGGFRNQCFKVDSDNKSYVLIIYKAEKGIRKLIDNAHSVASLLHSKGFPVRTNLKTKNEKDYIYKKILGIYHFIALYNFLEGVTIPWEAYTRRHLKSIGKTLSDLHYTFKQSEVVKIKRLRIDLPEWDLITSKEISSMKKYFKKVEPWIIKKLKLKLNWLNIDKTFKNLIKDTNTYPRNIMHYDFVRGNILFSNKLNKNLDIYPITGILDFEKVCIGPEIADIARTLAFLLVDCKFKDVITVRKRFLISGYIKRGKNKLNHYIFKTKEFNNLLIFFWLRDFWKFLVYNPYEYLYMNEHYKRTRQVLLDSKILLT